MRKLSPHPDDQILQNIHDDLLLQQGLYPSAP